jgi:hypothetical protein
LKILVIKDVTKHNAIMFENLGSFRSFIITSFGKIIRIKSLRVTRFGYMDSIKYLIN